jgi:hypothetical protein
MFLKIILVASPNVIPELNARILTKSVFVAIKQSKLTKLAGEFYLSRFFPVFSRRVTALPIIT